MTIRRKLLFLIASGAHARLVLPNAGEGGFATVWRAADGRGPHQLSREELLREVERQAHAHIAKADLEGLVVVAPAGEVEALSADLEHAVVVVGKMEADIYDQPDELLSAVLDKALHAPLPER